jgi:hydroxymethylpyrimidine pyrophosphatase-like HAD family hydrolase
MLPIHHRQSHHFVVAAVDLDDTLLRSDGTLSDFTLGVLSDWLAAGRRLVIATGRPPRTIAEKLPPLLLDIPWVCYNGAEIRWRGEMLFQEYIPAGKLMELIPRVLTQHPEAIVGMELDDLLWISRERNRPGRYRVCDLTTVAHLPTPKVLFWSERLDDLLEVIGTPPSGVRMIAGGRYPFVQLMSQVADKATALRVLLARWGLDMGNVVAFGDDVNDVEMLAEAGWGVAMANALDVVKRAAQSCTASNNEDGVARILEEILGSPPTTRRQDA